MKLTTALSAVNNNPEYYKFIPKQIIFWKHFNINFIAIFIGEKLPDDLKEYSDNIIIWSKNLDLHTAYISQIIRIYYPAILNLPDDELVIITDIDMLPINSDYFKNGLEEYTINDFIYYREINCKMIYMCYNAAHPTTWSRIFKIESENDIEKYIYSNYNKHYNGIPGKAGWFTDQQVLYNNLINYPNLKVLNRPIRRLEMNKCKKYLNNKNNTFIHKYDDVHFHRSYLKNNIYIY